MRTPAQRPAGTEGSRAFRGWALEYDPPPPAMIEAREAVEIAMRVMGELYAEKEIPHLTLLATSWTHCA